MQAYIIHKEKLIIQVNRKIIKTDYSINKLKQKRIAVALNKTYILQIASLSFTNFVSNYYGK